MAGGGVTMSTPDSGNYGYTLWLHVYPILPSTGGCIDTS